jgi:putative transposase
MDKSLLEPKRKSHIDIGEIYFWTATINSWQRLLEKGEYKDVIIDSLQYLSDAGKIDVFGFVFIPNHFHLIWRVNELNGKESPQGSFLKYTAHTFKKMLRKEGAGKLNAYKVGAENKEYELWQLNSLAIPLFTKK